MKPKVLLIQPPIQDFYSTPIRLFPLGLLQIATPLANEGYNIKILDCHHGLKRKTINIPEKFKYIKKYYDEKNKSPFRLFGNYYHFGISSDEIAENIRTYKPDIVGISCNFSQLYDLKQKYPHLKVLISIGGWTLSNEFSPMSVDPATRAKKAETLRPKALRKRWQRQKDPIQENS